MSLLQLDLPVDAVADKIVRRALINAIVDRTRLVQAKASAM